jgi:methyl-accepting chemotaxis protein
MTERRAQTRTLSWREFIPSVHEFRFGLKRWARGSSQRAREREWATTLRSVEQDLAGFTGSVEGAFLQTGERLMQLQLRSREIAAQTSSVTELLSNDGGALVVLDTVLQSASEDRQDHDVMESARAVQEHSLSIHRTIESFDRLVNTFEVLGMMTRIESARLEASGGTFAGLAETVMALSHQIRERIGATANSAKALLATTSQAGQEMQHAAQVRRENLSPLARQASMSIQTISDRRRLVAHANAQLAERFEGVSRAFGDLVESLQSHDIVRQQIEHVVEALHRVDVLDGSKTSRFATVPLQAAQMDNSRTTFERSVEQIRSALVRIARNIEEIAEDAGSLSATSDALREASFVSSLESNLAGILKVLESNAAAERLLAGAVVSIDQRVSEISGTIAGVQTIGVEMHRIALNATIQAARLGQDGGALEIVANSIQGLAREAGAASSLIEDRLSGIRDAALALDRAASRGDSAAQIPQLSRSAAGLNSIQDQVRDGYVRTIEKITGLKRQIGDTISAFGDQSDILERLVRVARLLHELSADGRPTAAPDVEQIAATYTMQSERDVHNALLDAREPQDQGSPLPDAAPSALDGQDDNVEFF